MRSPRDLWTGVIYLAFGGSAVALARGYGLGTAFRMGPGYFPTALGILLIAIGLASLVRGVLRPGDPLALVRLKGILAIVGSTVAFGLLVRGAGLVVALPVLVLLSAAASARFRWGPALALAAGLTVFCVVVFVKGLGVPLPLLGHWFGG